MSGESANPRGAQITGDTRDVSRQPCWSAPEIQLRVHRRPPFERKILHHEFIVALAARRSAPRVDEQWGRRYSLDCAGVSSLPAFKDAFRVQGLL
jgi:hypothetical protein